MVGGQFVQGGNSGRPLEKGLLSGLEELQGLHHELHFTDSAPAQFDVALQFARFDHFVLEAGFHGGHVTEGSLPQRAGIAKGLNHFQKFRP